MNELDDTTPRDTARRVSPRRRRLLALLVGLATAVLVVDQATKELAASLLTVGRPVPLLGDVLSVELVYNPGAAFSIATGMTWVFTVAAVAVTVVILRVSRRIGSATWAVALGLLLGGSVGNLVDRLLRDPGFARGHVVDFINYNDWFVGNVADIGIVAGAALVAVLALHGREIDGSLTTEDRAGHVGTAARGAAPPDARATGTKEDDRDA